jgi:hypothetical protein
MVHDDDPIIIGVSGYARSGKDTVGQILVASHQFHRHAFADKLKQLAIRIDDHVADAVAGNGWEDAKSDPYVRGLLQRLGVAARETIADDVWVTALFANLDLSPRHVITDVRFINEADAIRKAGGYVWRVNRPGVHAINDHVSEHQLDDYTFDIVLTNDGSIDDLAAKVASAMQRRSLLVAP